ncbi:MAG: cellulase family glycosylhydrolase, partial [Halanaerobiales bacterium]
VSAEPVSDDDWLTTEGNRIVDQDGNPVWLTGANWFGFNTGSDMFDGLWAVNLEDALVEMANRGINLLRIPVSTEILYQWSEGEPPDPGSLNDSVNPELEGMNSYEIFDRTVAICREQGIKIMIDIHSPASEAMGHEYPLWYDDTFTTEIWISTMEWLAGEYRDGDTILAFDLENEPHGTKDSEQFAKWDDSGDENDWKTAAEEAALKVLDVNPNLLVLVEGIEMYPKEDYDYTADPGGYGEEPRYYYNWWGGNLRGVADYPLDLGEHQEQLVYSPHDYGPSVHEQDWFEGDFDMDSLYEDVWYDNWAYIMEDDIAPLLIGEWGGIMDGGDNEKWMELLRDYMIENKIHHTFWCYNANSGDTGGLVEHDFETWEEDKYELLKPALWQDERGRFVSLDHEVPLGEDGITVTEYYENGGEPPVPPMGGGNGENGDNGGDNNGENNGEYELGDVNEDGSVNSMDLSSLSSYLTGTTVDISEEAADVNQDDMVDSLDVSMLQNYILGNISEF